MTYLKEITDTIECFAPLSYQDSYDNSGLIIGNVNYEVTGALFCVDVTEDVIDEAIALGLNMIISHHPLIFTPLKRITGASYIEQVIIKAIRNDIAIYSCHTNLDATEGGLSFCMANALSLNNIEILSKHSENSGYGCVGNLTESLSVSDFLSRVQTIFKVKSIRYSNPHKTVIHKVAVCSGSGSSVLPDAIVSGADIFLSADIKYNTFLDAQNNIIIADIGHFESEYASIKILYDIVKKKMPKFAAYKSERSVNPINYFI